MNPNEYFGKLYPYQIELQDELIKRLTEGFDEPAQPVYLPLPASKSAEHARERFEVAANALASKPIVAVWIDALAEIGIDLDALSADGIIYLDSMTQMLEWKVEADKPMPESLTEKVNITTEKPHVAMNDWRNNRGGRKHR